MNIRAVTTFNESGLNKYGHRMLESYLKHWSAGVHLTVYKEGWNEVTALAPLDELITYKALLPASPWLQDFKQRHAQLATDNYRFDAVRFSHKIAALLNAAVVHQADTQFLIWLDGDVITHSDFGAEHLDTLLPHDEAIAWLDRTRYYPECGFYILNLQHEGTAELLMLLYQMYAKDRLFELKEWHDSYVLQQCVIQLNVPVKSLSGPQGFPTHHPLINGPLGQWFDHLKGARKAKGKSLRADMFVTRDEAYWRGL